MDDDTLLLIAGVAIAGIALYSLQKPLSDLTAPVGGAVEETVHNVTGIFPWIEGQIESFEKWFGSYL